MCSPDGKQRADYGRKMGDGARRKRGGDERREKERFDTGKVWRRGGQMSDGPEASMAEEQGGERGSLVSRSGREESSGTLGGMVEESQGRGESRVCGQRVASGEIRIQLVLHCGSN